MKVYILFSDYYEGREVAGVYRSLEAAQARFPDVRWKKVERYNYEKGPPEWRSDDLDDRHIEEHDLEEPKP